MNTCPVPAQPRVLVKGQGGFRYVITSPPLIVYNIEYPDSPVNIAADTTEIGSSISYITEEGTFYLKINSANTPWTAQIWACKE